MEQLEIEQLPLEQVALALFRSHVLPHEPQLLAEFRFVSQPLAEEPSQLAQPAEHDPIEQVPPEQVALAFANEQLLPQLPQFEVVLSAVSHPLPVLPSQLPYPPLQLPNPQEPPLHVADALL